ncbi:MAG: TraR/DksA family transcriptional regulator [bacterium]
MKSSAVASTTGRARSSSAPAATDPATATATARPHTTRGRAAKASGSSSATSAPVSSRTGRATKPTAAEATTAGTPAHEPTAPRTPPKTRRARSAGPVVPAGSDWTVAQLRAVRADLAAKITDMQSQYDALMTQLEDLQRGGADGAGDDQADAGSKTFDREQELSILANRSDLLIQMQRALDRIDVGTYGVCESCGQPIPKARLQAFPMATLDVACKQREERR